MDIVKQAQGGQTVAVTEEQLEQINRFARRELKAEEVYSFSVRLCDNEVDRDGERFPRRTLEELAELFVGQERSVRPQLVGQGPGGPDLCRRGGAGGEAHPDRGALLLVEGVRLYGAHRGQRGPDP